MALEVFAPMQVGNPGSTIDSTSYPAGGAVFGSAYYDTGRFRDCVLHLSVLQEPDGTLPTLEIQAQDSSDMVHWAPIPGAQISLSGVSQAGTVRLSIPGPVGRYLRFVAEAGGTTPVYTVTGILSAKE